MGALREGFLVAVKKVEDASEEPGLLKDKLILLESKTKLKKKTLIYIALGSVALFMSFGYGARLLFLILGCLLPGFRSIMAMESGKPEEALPWL
ncbi:Receptor expression-enhancing protein, partial [Caligus rogercresseyi]